MTDFRDSGLPNTPQMFKAFLTYRQNIEAMPEPFRSDEAPLKVARLISEHTNDNQPVMAALLGLMPQATWGIVGKRFGADITDILQESRLHVATGYAYLSDASPAVKQLTMAGGITAFDRAGKLAEQVQEQLATVRLSGQLPPDFRMPAVLMPDTYAKIGRACKDTSGAPALEALYEERFQQMKQTQDVLIDSLAQVGIFLDGIPPGMAPAEIRYPAFENTGLMDTPKVRAAYDVLTSHTRVRPEDFEGALYVAQILGNVSATRNPTAIAAALVDVGMRDRSTYDMAFLQKKLDWDVVELLKNGSVYTLQHPQQVLSTPVEFRQIALANAVAVMDDAHAAGRDFVRMIAQHPEYPKSALVQSLSQLKNVSIMSQQIFAPALGRTDMPELDRLFVDKLKALNSFIDQSLPRQEFPAPKPQPARKPPGQDGPAGP